MLSPNLGKSGKRKKKKKSSAIDVLNFVTNDKDKTKRKKKTKEEKIAEEMKKYKVDDEGYIIDENGNRVFDADGKPMRPEDLVKSSDDDGEGESSGASGDEDNEAKRFSK